MNARPLVSVIMIFLDEARFLAEAIESVVHQQFLDWELLLVDDGSTDGSAEIAQRYARSDKRIHHLGPQADAPRGTGPSRNIGLAEACGDFVTFLDADDQWPNARVLQRLVRCLTANSPAAMAYGSATWWTSWSQDPEDVPDWLPSHDWVDNVSERAPARDAVLPPGALVPVLLTDPKAIPCPCSVIIRREIAIESRGFPPELTALFEDQALYLKASLEWPVFVSSECFGRYRQHREQICRQAVRDGTVARDERAYRAWARAYISARGLLVGPIAEALRAEDVGPQITHRSTAGSESAA
jgi:glycosyltransferase involved in cell wall biosynthesis